MPKAGYSIALSLAAILTHSISSSVFAGANDPGPCRPPVLAPDATVRDGYLDFISPAKLQVFKDALPQLENASLQAIMQSPDTIWYDEASMIFTYQDSIEVVTGARANCVGRKVGEENRHKPPIAKLMKYFGPDYRFRFPFRKVAGTDNVDNIRVYNFWAPPKVNGVALPVKWWKKSARGRWNWVFPVGTVFGEVLYQQSPDGQWYVFEVRTRQRYLDGWDVALFRPYLSAESLAQAVMRLRPNWQDSPNLTSYVQHLQNKQNLSAKSLVSEAFGKIFPPINGALDVLPDAGDPELIAELLTATPFKSAEGRIWKENDQLETYGPSSAAAFNIVPKNYEMGMIPVNEVSCGRCHMETGRRLREMEFDITLYGEIWGEDRIFTWHLFEPHAYIFGTYDDADGSRKVNSRLVRAKLVKNEKPAANDPLYRQLPEVFKPDPRLNGEDSLRP